MRVPARVRPIFIGGCERSGTTMLGSMLGAGPRAVCTPESIFKTFAFQGLPWPPTGRASLCRLWQQIKKDRFYRNWELELPEDATLPGHIGSFDELLVWLVRRYGRKIGLEEFDWWVDHSPHNLQHARWLRELFPDAKFIHLVRDGRAVAASALPIDRWGPHHIVDAGPWWDRRVGYGLAAEQLLAEEQIMRVQYEALLREPETTVREICRFTGLDFNVRMIGGGDFDVPKFSQKQHHLVGRPPDPSRATAWQKVLSKRQIEILEYFSAEMLTHLGYQPLYGLSARPPTKREWLAAISRSTLVRTKVNLRAVFSI